LALVLLLGALLGGGMMGPGMMGGYGIGGGLWGVGMAGGMLAMLAVPVLVIVGIALLVLWADGQLPARGGQAADSPQAILRRRYAAGEIDQTMFEGMQRELESESDRAPRQPVGTGGAPQA
jgi:uncharacterized membrane protein